MTEDRVYVPLQAWACGKCHAEGMFEAPTNASSLETTLRVAEAHREKSPLCAARWGVGFLRVPQTAPLPD